MRTRRTDTDELPHRPRPTRAEGRQKAPQTLLTPRRKGFVTGLHRSRLPPEQGPPETKINPSPADLMLLNERHWGLTCAKSRSFQPGTWQIFQQKKNPRIQLGMQGFSYIYVNSTTKNT